jgi:methylated-DNA-[protein]-cysteine S-methyltransferase
MTPPPRVRHTAEDITTLAGTEDGLVAATHLWWSEEGPVEDPLASDGDALTASRQQLLAPRARPTRGGTENATSESRQTACGTSGRLVRVARKQPAKGRAMTIYATFDSPLGELLLVGEESATANGGTALTSLSVPGQKGGVAVVQDGWRHDPQAFAEIVRQLTSYFDGTLTRFAIEYTAGGTAFQQRVWSALETIEYGTTLSYAQVADLVGIPRTASRAVGTAIGANPLLVVRPCHRVLGANGSLTGYAGGLERKRQLLDLENVRQVTRLR